MKRGYLLYLAFIPVALCLGLLLMQTIGEGACSSALRRLGKSEREFQEARSTLVLGSGDHTDALLGFILSPKRSNRTRVHGMMILQEIARQRPLHEQGARLAPLIGCGSRDFQVELFRTLEKLQVPAVAQSVWTVFDTATDSLVFSGSYRALRAAMGPLEERLEQAMRMQSDGVVDSCLTAMRYLPGGKGNAYLGAARYYREHGDSARAAGLMRRAGFMDTCWVLGPFDNPSADGLAKVLPPEEHPFSPNDVYTLHDSLTGRWHKIAQLNGEGVIDFGAMNGIQCCTVNYLFAYINAATDCDGVMLFNYGEPARVRLNDQVLREDNDRRSPDGDDLVSRVRLHAGTNTLSIKLSEDCNNQRIAARLTDTHGEALTGVRFSWTPQ